MISKYELRNKTNDSEKLRRKFVNNVLEIGPLDLGDGMDTKLRSEIKLSPIAEDICRKRYYQKDENGNPIENWEGLVSRVVNYVCKNENNEYKKEIFDLILETKFLPNSPCLVNAGTKSKSKGLAACYVVKSPEDCWSGESEGRIGMIENIANFGHVARQGGGAGVSLSKIRPENDPVFGSTHAKACGPIEHMRMISEVMSSITQSGFRSMAMLASLMVDHPDIEKFIVCKQHSRALKGLLKEDFFNQYDCIIKNIEPQLKIVLDKFIHNFNISVLITDDFMKKVENDEDFDLVFNGKKYKTVKAKYLFDLVVENAWKNGDPGLLFYDRINNDTYKYSGQKIMASNPCFRGDSMVAVADGRNFVSIKQLAEEAKDVPVYCCDAKSGAIHIKMGRNPRKTRENANLCRVTFDDGGSIVTTPDHKIYLRNGKTVKVKELLPGNSVMTMTKYNFNIGKRKYNGICRANGKPWRSEHRMIYEFYSNNILKSNETIHHKDFNGLNNSIENLEKMTFDEHSTYHRQFNNPMTHWYPNASLEEKQKYHESMSIATSGEKNGMYGRKHSKETLNKIGSKTRQRMNDPNHREQIRQSLIKYWQNDLNKEKQSKDKIEFWERNCSKREKQSLDTANRWKEGKYDSLKSKLVTKKCEYCGKEFTKKEFIAKKIRFCSSECGNQVDISNNEIIQNAIEFVNTYEKYPSVVTWKKFRKAICSREVIRKRFKNFQCLSEQLVDMGIFAGLTKNTNMTKKLIAGSIIKWTIKNGREPNCKEITKDICSLQSISRYGYKNIMELVDELSFEHCVNHKVVSVEMLDETSDVYNITVDKFHNLCILSSVCNRKKQIKKSEIDTSTWYSIVYGNCGEEPMPDFGACNLGSIDVSKLHLEDKKDLDWKKFKKIIHAAIRFLDNVISSNKFPTDEFQKWAENNRPVGLGVMGFADLLLKMKLPYGENESLIFAEKLASFLRKESHNASVILAKERGTPMACNYKELDYRRNVVTLSIAPTGTIAQIAECSHSIEPIYSSTCVRYDNTGKRISEHPLSNEKFFRCAIDANKKKMVTWEQHVKVQAAFQKHIDAGVSKTINMPNDATTDDVKNAYMLAWKSGLKGITIYRDGSKTAQVLNTQDRDKLVIPLIHAPKRPKEVDADIFRTKASGKEWHIIVGKVNDRPYELFAVNGSKELPEQGKVVKNRSRHYSLLDKNGEVLIENLSATEKDIGINIDKETRRFSLELRHGIHPKFIVQQIDRANENVASFCKAVTRIFATKYLTQEDYEYDKGYCPDCARLGKKTLLVNEGGCSHCPDIDCNYSKCG